MAVAAAPAGDLVLGDEQDATVAWGETRIDARAGLAR
jgi:hypothetical protein